MQKIIGLDIGSYSIKAVEILNHFKSYEISNFYEKVIPSFDHLPTDKIITSCMEQVFSENNIEADRVIAAMPGQYISSRILPFNFSDSNKIEAAVYAEIEDAVPFNLDEMIIDHQVLGTMGKKTMALVVLTRKMFIQNFIQLLQKINIDPKLVDVDSLSFYNLCPFIPMEEGHCYGIVDVGHEKTSVCLIQDGVLKMFRSINLGGRYITNYIARDFEISFNDAQRLKHDVSRILLKNDGTKLNSNEMRVARRTTEAVNAISRELGRTLYAFKTWQKSPLSKIFLSGGTSIIQNFDQYMADELGIETVQNSFQDSDLKINSELSPKTPYITQGISIGMRAVTSVKRYSQINMRKDEFAYVQDYEAIFKTAGNVFKIISFILVLLTVSYILKYAIYSKEIETVQSLYKKEFFDKFPDYKKKFKGDKYPFDRLNKSALGIIQDDRNAKNNSIDDFQNSNERSGALISLQQLSSSLPKDVEVNVVEYKYVTKPDLSGNLQLRVEADSFDTIAKFKDAISEVKDFSEVIEKSSDSKPGSDIKIAVLEIKYKSKEL